MSQWQSGDENDDDIIIADYAQHPHERTNKKSGLGLVIGVSLMVLGTFALLVVGTGLVVNLVDKAKENKNDADDYRFNSVGQRIREDLRQGKLASMSTEPPSQHPRYDEFEELIAAAEEAFDDSPNLKTAQLIDSQRHTEIKLSALRKRGYSHYELAGFGKSSSENITGPTPFYSAEILKIKSLNEDDYQVFIMLDTGYGPEPVVWWVTSRNGRLLIYDWSQLELGLRSTDEILVAVDAIVMGQGLGYEKYSELCYEYLDTAANSDYSERQARIYSVLRRMERQSLPRDMAPGVKLIIAKRWASEGEHAEALRMFLEMFNSRTNVSEAPGWYKLAGNSYFVQKDYSNAAKQYQTYRDILGDEPEVLQRLSTCYQNSGDFEAERDTRLLSVRFLKAEDSRGLLRLLSLLDEPKATEILDDVKSRQGERLLVSTLSTAKDTPYYWKELRQIKDYLMAVDPKSRVAVIGQLYEAQTRDDSKINPEWVSTALDDGGDQNDVFSSYSLWQEVAEKSSSDLLELLQSTGCSKDQFEVIHGMYDYEQSIDDELMFSVADMATKKHPQWYLPYLVTGNLQLAQDQPEAALESGNEALELFEKFEDVSGDEKEYLSYQETLINALRLSALYKLGEQEQARELAIEKDLVGSLISLKNEAEEFDGIEELLSELEPDNPLIVLQHARQNHANGKTERAIQQLVNHINKLDSEDGDSYGGGAAEYQLAQWCRQSDDPLKLFKLCPSASRFRSAFQRLLDQKRWEQCEQALEQAAKILSDDELLPSQIRLAWARKEYRKVSNLALRCRKLSGDYENRECFYHMVRSAIRSSNQSIAQLVADVAKEKFSDDLIAVIAAIATDKLNVAKPLLNTIGEYELANLINDEDVGTGLIQAVQQKQLTIGTASMIYAGSRNYSSAALLTKSPLIMEPLQIKTVLEKAGAEAIGDVEKLEDQKPGIVVWRSSRNDREVWFVQSQLDPADESDLTDEQKQAGVDQAKYLLSVVVFDEVAFDLEAAVDPKADDEQQVNDDSETLARTIAAQFVSDQCLAFESQYDWVSVDQLRDESGTLKSDRQIVDALAKSDWWYYAPESYETLKEEDGKSFQDALGNAARMFEKGQLDEFSVSAAVDAEAAQQLVTMNVESIEVSDYDVSFIGVVAPDSPLASRFVQEIKYSVSFDSVIEFSSSKPGSQEDGSQQTFRKKWKQVTK